MNNKKILKIVGIIIAILLIIFIIHTVRNFIIIKKLQNKIMPYKNMDNYSIKITTTNSNGYILIVNHYKKGIKQANIMERTINGEVAKISMYYNGSRTDTFTIPANSDKKYVSIDNNAILNIQIFNGTETDNLWQTILGSMTVKIRSTKYNDKDCYVINNFLSAYLLSFNASKDYYVIDKETGLLLENYNEESKVQREYEFNNVDDSVFVEPDIGEYEIQNNN